MAMPVNKKLIIKLRNRSKKKGIRTVAPEILNSILSIDKFLDSTKITFNLKSTQISFETEGKRNTGGKIWNAVG